MEPTIAFNPTSSHSYGTSPVITLGPACKLVTAWAQFDLLVFRELATSRDHLALTLGVIDNGPAVLVRMHSECLTGDTLFSRRCDCGEQLHGAVEAIANTGRGALLYLRQEGRGIGLLNKVMAYGLQDAGADTIEANHTLGFPSDARNYAVGAAILHRLGVTSVRLLTNNPSKISGLEHFGVRVTERVPLLVGWNEHNARYLKAKAEKLAHLL